MKTAVLTSESAIVNRIYLIRGKKVMLDKDLAEMYGVETRVMNQAVRRNRRRSPEDFMFQMTLKELSEWKSQVTTSRRERIGLRKQPLAFTEQGVAMLSSVLNSETAIEVNIRIIRVFTRMREVLFSNKKILLKLERMERKALQQDVKLNKHEKELQLIFTALKELLNPKIVPMRKIGFKRVEEV